MAGRIPARTETGIFPVLSPGRSLASNACFRRLPRHEAGFDQPQKAASLEAGRRSRNSGSTHARNGNETGKRELQPGRLPQSWLPVQEAENPTDRTGARPDRNPAQRLRTRSPVGSPPRADAGKTAPPFRPGQACQKPLSRRPYPRRNIWRTLMRLRNHINRRQTG